MTIRHVPTYTRRRPAYPGLEPLVDFTCTCSAKSAGITETVAHQLIERHRAKNGSRV